ncbi:MAG: sensor histidine kinase [Cyanobacteria bacterium J06634_6]
MDKSGSIATISPSLAKTLRYVEWTFLAMLALRMLSLFLNRPLAFEMGTDEYVLFSVAGILTVLSNVFPVERPTWQRRAYIFVEIFCLLISRAFSEYGLNLFLYFVFVKSCFLLSRKDVIYTTVVSGVAWQICYVWQLTHEYSLPVEELRANFEEQLAMPRHLVILDTIINSSVIYVAASLLVILLSLTVISERKSRQRAANLSQEVEALATDLERTRIARDIHDSLGHTLTALNVQLEVAQTLRTEDPPHSLFALDRAKQLSSQSLQEVRRAVSTMRSGYFDLSDAIADLILQVEQTHASRPLKIKTRIELPPLSLQVSQQLFLIVKEGLTNIQKHSQASVVKLWAEQTPEGIVLNLSDNGVGFSSSSHSQGFGLRGMHERVQLLEGRMAVHSTIGKGTVIQVTIPV